MACPHCNFQERFETKEGFPYYTQIVDGHLIVSKKRSFLDSLIHRRKYPKLLYGNDIKYCPMCGQKLSEVKSIGPQHAYHPDRKHKLVHAGGCLLNTYIEYEDEKVNDGNE